MHREFDQGQETEAYTEKKYDKFSVYRRSGKKQTPSSNSQLQANMAPNVRRDYKPVSNIKQRYTADDLVDKDNSASLWSGEGKDSYLFTTDQRKRSGDIIIINVMGKLKDEITAELKRAVPERKAPLAVPEKDKKDGKEDKSKKENTAAKPPEDKEDPASNPSTVYDKISGVIVEEINDDHVLLSGRKSLLFRNKKHLIEVQALVNRKHISFEDMVKSDDILENNVNVLR
jgi:flagellar basal body L-ring protein FlgH